MRTLSSVCVRERERWRVGGRERKGERERMGEKEKEVKWGEGGREGERNRGREVGGRISI